MAVSEMLRQAIRECYNAEEVKVVSNAADGAEKVFAYGMLPDTTVLGWFPLGELDELEERLRDNGEL